MSDSSLDSLSKVRIPKIINSAVRLHVRPYGAETSFYEGFFAKMVNFDAL